LAHTGREELDRLPAGQRRVIGIEVAGVDSSTRVAGAHPRPGDKAATTAAQLADDDVAATEDADAGLTTEPEDRTAVAAATLESCPQAAVGAPSGASRSSPCDQA
jgi:hypothetical protein